MGELRTNVDVVVIGAGPGGYTAAIRAAQLGLEVALIEKGKLGGCCTNVGCIPSKALLYAAGVKHDAESEDAKRMGVNANITFDFAKTQHWKDEVVDRLRNGIFTLCKLNGIEVIQGRAFFTSSSTLSVETESGLREIDFKKAIIATGTKINSLPGLPFDHKRIIDSDDVFQLPELPKNIVIIGGGYVAVEMATLFLKLGSKVTLVYRGPRLLKKTDPEISDLLAKKLMELGANVLLESDIARVEGRTAFIKTKSLQKEIEFDKLLLTLGRSAYYDELGLDKTEVRLDKDNLVVVDQTMRTTDHNIYAVGDITPGPQLAHKAFRQGKVAAEVIAGIKSAFDNRAIPSVVFSDPEIASVGLSEEEARARGEVVVGKMPFSASGKAKAINQTDGFVKIIANKSGVVLGVHVIGAGAEDIIAEASLAIEMGAMLEDLAVTIHAHPTLPESLAEAAEDALGTAIHIYKNKKM